VDAAAHGALVLNHARAIGYLRDADGIRVVGARVTDEVGGREIEVRARYTVNATGPWLDQTVASLGRDAKPLLRLTKGTHLVIPRATEQAHVLFAKRDGRLFFVLPWNGYTMVGTTDTDYTGDPADAEASEDDVEYLRSEAAHAFPRASLDRIHFTWAGVRALVRVEGVTEGEVSRKHALLDHERAEGVPGVLSVIGGKITAYRLIAAEVTDLVARRLGSDERSTTAQRPLPGAAEAEGGSIEAIIAGDPALAGPVCEHSPTTRAEVVRAVRDEWAVTIGDVLLRRTAIGLAACQGLDRLDEVADLIARTARWDDARRAAEIAAYKGEIAPMRKFATA
jgi:glycerol-3-phosphate dehydrogenase